MVTSDNKPIRPLAEFFNQAMSGYYKNTSTTIACQTDQRFSYCTYLPKSWTPEKSANYQLLVVIHGSDRVHYDTREQFIELAEQKNLIILSPLFPVGVIDPQDTDGYKYIKFHGIRFDLLLLDMIKEVEIRFSTSFDKFSMFGFSGGAHFAHRFFYLYPEKIFALSIAAPGSVTLLQDTADWWVGTRNFQQTFGKAINIEAMRIPPIQLLVGAEDTENGLITHSENSPNWVPGANDAGEHRIQRLKTLHTNWVSHGLRSHFEILQGVKHSLKPLAQKAASFFHSCLDQ